MLPIQKLPRITIIDSLRGFALAGVAISHFTIQFLTAPTPEGFQEGINSMPDMIVRGFMEIFINGKFYSIFSILFGLSFVIQMQSAEKRSQNFAPRFLWRAFLLFFIGYFHHLFYGGDILTIYAVLAPFIIPFYNLKKKWVLLLAGLIFTGLPRFLTFFITNGQNLFDLPLFSDLSNPLNVNAFNAIHSGTLLDVFHSNFIYGMQMKINYQVIFSARLYHTYGYFILGLWLGRLELFRNIENFLPQVKKTLKITAILLPIILGLMIVSFIFAPQPIDFSRWMHIIGMNFYDLVNFNLTIIIITSFILLFQKKKWQARFMHFAPYGRMALTNYVLQSLIGTFIIYGWGLGLMGEIRTLYLFLMAIIITILQVKFSKIWLSNFKFGPFEWLWRCGTYLKWQPFIKENKPTPQAVKVNIAQNTNRFSK